MWKLERLQFQLIRHCLVRTNLHFIPGGNFDLFHFSNHSSLLDVVIANVNPTKYGIMISDIGIGTIIQNIIFASTQKPIYLETLTQPTQAIFNNIAVANDTTDIITVTDNNSGFPAIVTIQLFGTGGGSFNNAIKASGPTTQVTIEEATIYGSGVGNGINVLNGATVVVSGSLIQRYANGITMEYNISAPEYHWFFDSLQEQSIQH